MSWTQRWCEDAQKRLKKFGKKWKHEVRNVADNLTTLIASVEEGSRSEQLKKLGFVRSEPSGILAIDESGPGKGSRMKALRLYVYLHEEKEDLYILTLGDKDSQEDDIKLSQVFVSGLREHGGTHSTPRLSESNAGQSEID